MERKPGMLQSMGGHQELDMMEQLELMINLDQPVRDREWNGGVQEEGTKG